MDILTILSQKRDENQTCVCAVNTNNLTISSFAESINAVCDSDGILWASSIHEIVNLAVDFNGGFSRIAWSVGQVWTFNSLGSWGNSKAWIIWISTSISCGTGIALKIANWLSFDFQTGIVGGNLTIAKGSVLEGTGIVCLLNSKKICNWSGTTSNTTVLITSSLDVPVVFGFSFANFYKLIGNLKFSPIENFLPLYL